MQQYGLSSIYTSKKAMRKSEDDIYLVPVTEVHSKINEKEFKIDYGQLKEQLKQENIVREDNKTTILPPTLAEHTAELYLELFNRVYARANNIAAKQRGKVIPSNLCLGY
jgi:hypothetical protein